LIGIFPVYPGNLGERIGILINNRRYDMAYDAFLKIDAIPGESTDERHKDWIEILSFRCGITQPATVAATGSGGSTERPCLSDFTVVHPFDKASPKLFLACARGERIKEVIVQFNARTRDKATYLEYKLSDVIVSSVKPGGAAEGGETMPLEEVSFNFRKIELQYVPQNPDGSLGTPIKAVWDTSPAGETASPFTG
jgi:type VI secretion system secreted protein Hcp